MSIFARSVILMVRPSNVIRCIFTTSIRYKNEKFQEDMFHVKGHEPSIPNYTEREGESIDRKKARLLYQSRKRGMLENGLLLSTFAKKYLNDFDDDQLRMYDRLINLPTNDWDIFYWATGVKPTPPEFNNEIMDLLKKHTQNENRDARIVQPDL